MNNSNLDYMNLSIKLDNSFLIKSALTLRDLNGSLLNNEIIQINPYGIIDKEKKKKEGITFFGFSKKNIIANLTNESSISSNNNIDQNNNIRPKNIKASDKNSLFHFDKNSIELTSQNKKPMIDYELNDTVYQEYKDKIVNPLFAIFFSIEYQDYFFVTCKPNDVMEKSSNNKSISLNNNNIGMVQFKLECPLILKKDETLSIGNVFFEVKTNKKELILTKIQCKIKEEEKISNNTSNDKSDNIQRNTYVFNGDEIKEVSVGRDKSCTICINNSSLSRINLTFKYYTMSIKDLKKFNASNAKKILQQFIENDVSDDVIIRFWVIYDGDSNKPSTNGVWMFCLNQYVIYDGFTIRLGKNKVQINKIETF